MIDWTYSHFRILMRILAPNALIYTEMQTPEAVKFNPERSLFFNKLESPLAIQLGSGDPNKLVEAAKMAELEGYCEINLNLGCPSDKVQSGSFGACLMKEPQKVSKCIAAMKAAVSIPVTAKTRIGVDDYESYSYFANFAKMLIDSGIDKLIVHARKAWLKGLSPKQNRTIPSINYDYVYQIKNEFPDFPIVINGDIKNIPEVKEHLKLVDGVMLGRLSYKNSYMISEIHKSIYQDSILLSRKEIIEKYISYANSINNPRFSLIIKPLFNLFHGQPGSAAWKNHLMQAEKCKNLDIILYNIACYS
ncbi:MAG: tRNA dihydrouridine(20/20a) synthase DusA [Legionellales bacterium RIFCSPHIGHO2_12_FULL_35_11]|nr:MAG: tRNA dihydrouridine(20/20a) synthase DusA [Legionellales bacterium RIFCSPHIGHO2_12_FULL_35_11]